MRHQQAVHVFFAMLACFVMHAAVAQAELPDSIVTARELYTQCTSKYDTDAGYCVGYVTAVTNRMAFAAIDGYGPCTFGAARSQQFANIFTAYAQSYPDSLHAPAESIIAAAIGRAFPCQRN